MVLFGFREGGQKPGTIFYSSSYKCIESSIDSLHGDVMGL